MNQHVGVLLLRALRAVALGIGIGRDVEGVEPDGAVDMLLDILSKARIDLVQDVLAVPQ